jgi:hypothetical protein
MMLIFEVIDDYGDGDAAKYGDEDTPSHAKGELVAMTVLISPQRDASRKRGHTLPPHL